MSAPARAVLMSLVTGGPSSRSELAAEHGVSRSSLTRIARELVDNGLVAEGVTELRAPTGRPSELLRVKPDARHFVGIKLTADVLYAAVVDLGGTVIAAAEQALGSRIPADVAAQIVGTTRSLQVETPTIAGVGVTLAGSVVTVGSEQMVIDSEFLQWRDLDLSSVLSSIDGLPVTWGNDVQALAATEHWFGPGAHLDSLVLITVGAGVGCGIIANGALVLGATGSPGRLAHLPIDRSGPICRSGHRGCANVYLTNDAIARSISQALGSPVNYAEAVELAQARNPAALRGFDDAGAALGQAVGLVSNLLDPQKIVVTGDGLALWEISPAAIRHGIELSAERAPELLKVEAVPFEFEEWARAAGVLALQAAVDIAR